MPKADWAGAAGGAVSGAGSGFVMGGAPGGVIGGILGGVSGLWGGGRKKSKKRSTLDKRQKQLNDLEHDAVLGKGDLADLYNYDPDQANNVFDQTISNPAYRNFEEKVIPGITGQFRSQGLMNSSYSGDSLSKAGRDVQEQLNGLRSKYLYDEQKDARSAKRNAVENLQNRTTFDYDKNTGGGGVDINSILKNIPPEAYQALADYFKSGGK